MSDHFPTLTKVRKSSSNALRQLKSREFMNLMWSEWGLLRTGLYVLLVLVLVARVGLISLWIIESSAGQFHPMMGMGYARFPNGAFGNGPGNGSWIQTFVLICFSIIGPPPTDILVGVVSLVGLAVTARRPRRRLHASQPTAKPPVPTDGNA
jgi:hypothetical protein